jgi:Uma2 family endonuclease
MSAATKQWITPEQYLARERAAAFKSEYYQGEMFAMAGTSVRHCTIKDNLARGTGNQLLGTNCRVVTSDLRVKIPATGLYTYPDLVIWCGKPAFEDTELDTLLNPRAIAEVLSESTESYDRGKKFAHYRTIPSLQEYILASQDEPLLERFARQADGSWSLMEFSGLASVLEFASVQARVPLSEVYDGVEFGAASGV